MEEIDYPTDDGRIDYDEIISQLNLDGVSPVNPTYFTGGPVPIAVIGVKPSMGLYSFVHLERAHNREVCQEELKSLYAKHERAKLAFRHREFLAPHNGVFDAVEGTAIPDFLVSDIVDALGESEGDHESLIHLIQVFEERSDNQALKNQ